MMVIVGFQARVQSTGLAWLKQGFRHCFAYRLTDEGWVLCDPLASGLLLRSAPRVPLRTLLACMAAVGTTVVAVTSQPGATRLSWLRPVTCVEICKRLLGLGNARVLTPYQLFRGLLTATEAIDSPQNKV